MVESAVLVFGTYPASTEPVRAALLDLRCRVTKVVNRDQLRDALVSRSARIIVVLASPGLKRAESLEVVRSIHQVSEVVSVVLVVADSSEEFAIAALQAGVNEYVRLASLREELPPAIARCIRPAARDEDCLSRDASAEDGIVGESAAMQGLRRRIENISQGDSNVLITGETGTGKELFAALVHKRSRRRHHPFVAINCAAIPDSLLESELFGHAKGAFTGADSAQDGKLKAADRGTIFLDEIGDMSAYSQAKILRVLENKEIQRLGCARGIPIDVRVVAATNQNLELLGSENKFRRDLFFRLNVSHIHLPPLRERKEDLFSLLDYYLQQFSRQFQVRTVRLTDEALECLFRYEWPGNVRELKNVLESLFAEGLQGDITLQDLPLTVRHGCSEPKMLPTDERGRMLWALGATNWNKSQAAARLRWSRMTLYRKMARYQILKEQEVTLS